MIALLEIVLPVFLVVGAGYIAVWRKFISDEAVSGLMNFSQNFAIPCLLFVAIAKLDLAQTFQATLLGSYYIGSIAGFIAGLLGARLIFRRAWEDSIAIGFTAMFSNSVLMGLSVTESAYGAGALGPNYAIIALHAPFCYTFGFIVMEIARSKGGGFTKALAAIGRAIVKNALMIGIALGFLVNLTGFTLPGVAWSAIDLLAVAGLPTALFGLGGVLFRYRPEGDMITIAYVCAISLTLHPAIVWGMGRSLELSTGEFRSAVLTGAMAPGVNAYIFANMYGVAKRVVASSVLIGTALSVVTASLWLSVLP